MFREPTDQQQNVFVLEDGTGSCLTWTRSWVVPEHAICLGNISGNVLFFESWDSTADKTEFLSRISKAQPALLWVTQFKNRTERGALDLVFLVDLVIFTCRGLQYMLIWQIGQKTVGIGPTQSWAPVISFQSILAATHQLNSENQNCIVFVFSCSIQLLFCFSHNMDIAQCKFMAKVGELFNNRDNADVTLYCEGESIMAHSYILEMRWDTGM